MMQDTAPHPPRTWAVIATLVVIGLLSAIYVTLALTTRSPGSNLMA